MCYKEKRYTASVVDVFPSSFPLRSFGSLVLSHLEEKENEFKIFLFYVKVYKHKSFI